MRGAPQRGFRGGHEGDQRSDPGMDGGAPSGRAARELGPVGPEATPLPFRPVSGVTMMRDCLQPAQILGSPAQKRRSVLLNRGRVIMRL